MQNDAASPRRGESEEPVNDYDMEHYQRQRNELATYSDQQVILRALARILAGQIGQMTSFEYQTALIDDLIRRAGPEQNAEIVKSEGQ